MICCKCGRTIDRTYDRITDFGNYCRECAYKNEIEVQSSIEKVKAQAVKEFAEKLKEKFYYVFGNEYEQSVSGFDTKVLIEHINETLKEYEE